MQEVNVSQINAFRREVDLKINGGNENGVVDGSEIEIFNEKLKSVGVNPDEYTQPYNTDRFEREASYKANGTKSDDSVETAVIAALNQDSNLNKNKVIADVANKIVDRLKDIDKSWFESDKEVEELFASVFNNKDYEKYLNDIILNVVNDDDAISALDDEASDEIKNKIVSMLIDKAGEKGANVSNIVSKNDGEYIVGKDVPGNDCGEGLNDSRSIGEFIMGADTNFEAVVKTLRNKINSVKEKPNVEKPEKDEEQTPKDEVFVGKMNEIAKQYDGKLYSEMCSIAKDYNFHENAWCADYVWYVATKVYGEENLPSWYVNCNHAYVPTIENEAKRNGALVSIRTNGKLDTSNVKKDDAVLFDWQRDSSSDHIGIVDKIEGGYVYSWEGNVEVKGGKVAYMRRPLSDVRSFVRVSPNSATES